MTAREFLNQYKEADRIARRLRAEYERELELIDAIKSTSDIDGLPRGKQLSKVVEDRAVRLADKAAEWKIAELDALHQRQVVFDMVSKISGRPGEVLYLRHVKCLTWKEVCAEVPMSWPALRPYYQEGLRIVEQKLQESTT